jgi:hypothetical protein
LAGVRLMTSSNLIGCMSGSSSGFADWLRHDYWSRQR